MREAILNIIPADLKLRIGAGIGFYLAFIGLTASGIIEAHPTTYLTLGNLFTPAVLLAILGIFISLILYLKQVQSAVFIGMIITAAIGLVMTFFGFGAGNELMPSLPEHAITTTFDLSLFGGFARGFGELFSDIPNLIILLFTLVFISFFDATGTLISLSRQCGFVNEEGEIKGIGKALLSTALGGIIGSIFGTSTITAYIESATGIGVGSKTGLTAIVIGILFILSIFISPLILSLFTTSVTTAALIIVGILIIGQLKDINWDDLVVTSSVFITILMMILTYSISLGMAWGLITYAVGKIATGKFKEINLGIYALAIVFGIYIFFGL
ncbi:MAG: NCS2 family permease [Methanobrevibacter sp.]